MSLSLLPLLHHSSSFDAWKAFVQGAQVVGVLSSSDDSWLSHLPAKCCTTDQPTSLVPFCPPFPFDRLNQNRVLIFLCVARACECVNGHTSHFYCPKRSSCTAQWHFWQDSSRRATVHCATQWLNECVCVSVSQSVSQTVDTDL